MRFADDDRQIERDPSPEEIAEATRLIRQKWSEQEHRKRAGLDAAPGVQIRRARVGFVYANLAEE